MEKKDLEKRMEELQQRIIHRGITNHVKKEGKDLQRRWAERSKHEEKLLQHKSML